ncbi:hypothetical protein [Herbiconiux daphne]|uniref:Bacteriophage tail tape measure N-terminal domain-containing protein n=1 Tax=Herbiconiux daphne TaxID=2970914 RepID=A0ABT2GWQ8_9MICO|nr:hypothetical protein [Herbiconiux daphne]MCS5732382.1 hypothetical protein [Herbiconiux daphne]
MAATKADAAELGRLNPTVKVDTDAAGAIAQLEATVAAADRVGASSETLRVRQGVLAGAWDRVRDSTLKANEANRTSFTRIGMITTAVALLLPLLPALGAFAVGAAGALTLMGLAGVAALFGIHQAMQDGTAVGLAYSSGLQSIKGNLQALAQTAAVTMLSSFRDVVRDTNSAMPMLNRQTAEFAGFLGRSGSNLFSGALSSLRALEPFLIRVGVYVEGLTAKFNAWTTNGGLQKFASYAISQLPTVEAMLGALGNTIMHILQALAPLGTVGLTVLTVLSQVIAAIPVQVLTDLIAAATWGALAFKAWGFIAPMLTSIATAMGAVEVATKLAQGPIGWIIAGVSALAGILAVSIARQQAAADAVRDYTAAVQADTGALGDNVRAAAVKALTDAGALAAAQRLGISVKEVTDATLGNASAQAKLDAELTKLESSAVGTATKMQDLTTAQQEQVGDVNSVRDAYEGQNDAIEQAIDAYNTYADAMGQTTITSDAQKAALEANAAAAGVSVSAYLSATASQSDAQAQVEKTTAAMYLQSDAAGLLKQSLDLLNGKTISYEQAQNQFDSGLTHLSNTTIQVADANGVMVDAIDAGKASLDSHTASGTEARGELLNLVTAAQDSATAFRDQGGSVEETKAKMADMKQQIIDNAVANGWNRDAVQAYIDKLFEIPADIPPTQIEVDTAAAEARLESFIAQMSGRVIDIQVNANNPAIGFGLGDGHADGGTIRGPGSASSDTAGLYPLSDGEEVISNRNGQADRFRGVLKQINAGTFNASSFGAGLRARSSGGGSGQAPVSSSSSSSITNHWNINQIGDPNATAAAIARRQSMLNV